MKKIFISLITGLLTPFSFAIVMPLPPVPTTTPTAATPVTPATTGLKANSAATQALIDQLFANANYHDFAEQTPSSALTDDN